MITWRQRVQRPAQFDAFTRRASATNVAGDEKTAFQMTDTDVDNNFRRFTITVRTAPNRSIVIG